MNFIQYRKTAFLFSGALILISVLALVFSGLNLGIDFTGGTIMQLRLADGYTMDDVRDVLTPFNLQGSALQRVGGDGGNEVVIRSTSLTEEERNKVLEAFRERWPQMTDEDVLQVDNVGAVIGRELTRQAFFALALATVGMILYITLRFEFKFAISTIAAMLHDVIIVLGIFSLLQLEINTPFVAAILTIVGYTVNDTIVIIDRIRENLKYKKGSDYPLVVNDSIKQSLVRCLNTSITTLFVLLSLMVGFSYFVGSLALSNFAIALVLGVIIGTYSSIFVASPLWLSWKQWEFSRQGRVKPAPR